MMRWILFFWLGWVAAAEPLHYRATVVRVVDGDTVRMRLQGRSLSVRLDSIDAPERRQAGGQEAKRALRRLLPEGSEARVVSFGEDRYRRLLAQVYRNDGLNVNVQLVREGRAWVYTRYCRDLGYWGPLEGAARRARRGLWADPQPEPPWRYRDKNCRDRRKK